MKVLIIGSGLAGLSLAQSLRKAKILFEIFERDKTPFDRPQGYRLHLDADAINTVKEVLPSDLQKLFNETSSWTEPDTDIMDSQSLKVIKRLMTEDDLGTGMWTNTEEGETPVHANVDRAVLRQILLTGLNEHIHWGKQFERYESLEDGTVTAYFTDDSSATGSVLVGADGINSRVRRQRAPTCETMDAGITAIYGRLSLSAIRELGPKEALEDIVLIGMDFRKPFLGLGSVIFPTPPNEAAKTLETENEIHAQENYAVCIIGGRHDYFPSNAASLRPTELQNLAVALLNSTEDEWSPNTTSLLRSCDPNSFFLVRMRSSIPSSLARSANVTLLGDAIHAMTPSLGRGANLAMRHGCLLGRHLRKAAEGKGDLAGELGAYEDSMTEYGFKVVREAAEMGRVRVGQTPLPE